MADKTKIEWCDATINPFIGCSKCSPGCDNCYAEKIAMRFPHFAGTTDKNGWTGTINPQLQQLEKIKTWKKPRKIFVGSMTDCFHGKVTLDMFMAVMKAIYDNPRHTFIMLTKRPENMRKMMNSFYLVAAKNHDGISPTIKEVFPNLWLGVTVCNQEEADKKIPILLQTPAAKRFVSIEPMLGEIDLNSVSYIHSPGFFGSALRWHHLPGHDLALGNSYPAIDWVICGGETGHNARPAHPDWVRSLRDQCVSANVPFFFKQWGEWQLKKKCNDYNCINCNYKSIQEGYALRFCRIGNKSTGSLLDGIEWKQFPEVR